MDEPGMEMTRGSMVERMIGSAFLNVDTFEEVEHDQTATGQAAGVVAMVAAAQAIGASGTGLGGAVSGAIGALVGWGVWAGVTYLIGTRVFEGKATWGECLRTLGFAQAPGILAILGILPILGIVNWFLWIWIAVAAFIGLRQALDLDNVKTFFTIVIGWAVYVAVAIAAGMLAVIF